MSKLQAFARLGREEKRVFLRAWVVLLGIELLLRWTSLPTLQRWLRGAARGSRPTGLSAETISSLVDRAGRHHLRPMTCLRQALCVQYLLWRDGVESDLRIGVRKEGEGLEAHAWIERDERPVGPLGRTAASFAPFGAWEH